MGLDLLCILDFRAYDFMYVRITSRMLSSCYLVLLMAAFRGPFVNYLSISALPFHLVPMAKRVGAFLDVLYLFQVPRGQNVFCSCLS